jgi:uncharacterized membrane protein
MRVNPTFLMGLGAGAVAMYLADPNQGKRRRALARDAAIRGARTFGDAAGATARDVGHRVSGVAARLRHRTAYEVVPDRVLVDRVRAKLGRYVSHPRAIDVSAVDGIVTLAGPILAHEHGAMLAAIRSVRGVREVSDRLEPHRQAGNIPDLQGGAVPTGEPGELWQRQWTPAVRALAGISGASLALYGAARRDATGTMLTALGLGLLARGTTNLDAARLTGIGAGRGAVVVQKTIAIQAPVERVFDIWRRIADFPQFTSWVRDVQVSGDLSHWSLAGPAGIPLEFDAVVTELATNERMAWKTREGSAVQHAGVIRFEPERRGGTRVHLRMSYTPPGGAVGHAAAAAFGRDLSSAIDADLLRIKSYIETGRVPHDAAGRSSLAFS